MVTFHGKDIIADAKAGYADCMGTGAFQFELYKVRIKVY